MSRLYRQPYHLHENAEEHIRHVDKIPKTLTEAGLTVMMNMCASFRYKVEYPGQIMLRPGKREVDTAHTASLRQGTPPTNKCKVRLFLTLCSDSRRSIPDFLKLPNRLTNCSTKENRTI